MGKIEGEILGFSLDSNSNERESARWHSTNSQHSRHFGQAFNSPENLCNAAELRMK